MQRLVATLQISCLSVAAVVCGYGGDGVYLGCGKAGGNAIAQNVTVVPMGWK